MMETIEQRIERLARALCAIDCKENDLFCGGCPGDNWKRYRESAQAIIASDEEAKWPFDPKTHVVINKADYDHLNTILGNLFDLPKLRRDLDRVHVDKTHVVVPREVIQPFVDFIKGPGEKMPDDMPLTSGSSMARRQVTTGDFQRLMIAASESGK